MNDSIDCTFLTSVGNFNFRIGVIIINGRKILMARNPNDTREYYYSVGGRVKFGESLTDAVIREV
ncbi:MAG: NUDIX domain-containing protein, partial [Clostridia bacterium]|nr:NUDIX domain-containing protein [Clostridia bacterium]